MVLSSDGEQRQHKISISITIKHIVCIESLVSLVGGDDDQPPFLDVPYTIETTGIGSSFP